ncbi:MAG: MarR family winged helix-turn-helix transcriptional regulator [Anaerolineae bacterium]
MSRHQDISSLDQAVAYIIQRTARLLRFNLDKTIAQSGADITPEQWFILFKLWNQSGVSQNTLTDPVLNDEPNITRQVTALEEKGYLMRVVDEQDKRRRLVSLTAQGRLLMVKLFPIIIDVRETIFDGITPAELDILVDILHRIEDNLA